VSRRAGDVVSRELRRELRVRGDADEGTSRARGVRGALRVGDDRGVVREGRGGEDVGKVCVRARARRVARARRRGRRVTRVVVNGRAEGRARGDGDDARARGD